jgi:hypothetical protein
MPNNTDPGNLYSSTVSQIGHGDLIGQASYSLEELVKAVKETGKSGEMTVTLKIKPRGRDAGQVEVTGTVKVSSPINDIAPSMFFATDNGELLRDNPAQRQFPFGDEAQQPQSVAINQ